MNLTQLWKTGLAVMFGFTLTLSTIGCKDAAAPADPADAAADVDASDEHAEGDDDDHEHSDEEGSSDTEAPAPE